MGHTLGREGCEGEGRERGGRERGEREGEREGEGEGEREREDGVQKTSEGVYLPGSVPVQRYWNCTEPCSQQCRHHHYIQPSLCTVYESIVHHTHTHVNIS